MTKTLLYFPLFVSAILLSLIPSGASMFWILLTIVSRKKKIPLVFFLFFCCLCDVLFLLPLGSHLLIVTLIQTVLSHLPTRLGIHRLSLFLLSCGLLCLQALLSDWQIGWMHGLSFLFSYSVLSLLSRETILERIG